MAGKKTDKTEVNNLQLWDAVCEVDPTYLSDIKGGRLKGKTDINPMWRYRAITEQFGLCGIGWKYTVDKKWTEAGIDGEVLAYADVSLYIKHNDTWSDAIPGNGGNKQVSKEQGGLYNSDECYKMAITDALSAAMKLLGFGANIYAGLWDGSKYKDDKKQAPQGVNKQQKTQQVNATPPTAAQRPPQQPAGQQETSELDEFLNSDPSIFEETTETELTDTLIDINWLEEQLALFKKRKLKNWTDAKVLAALNKLSGGSYKTIREAAKALNQDQAQYFCNIVQDVSKML